MREQITEIKHRLAKIEGLKDYQRELEQRLEEHAAKLEVAAEIAEKENQDVEKLNHASFASVVAWFAKDKEERVLKEEQEALKAMLYLQQLQEENACINEDLVRCEEEIAQEDALREALERLQKEVILQGELKEEAAIGYAQFEQEQLLEKELQEAIEASYVVTDGLHRVLNELESASAWGTMDVLGGGLVSSMVKHSHVHTAQEKVAELKQNMLRFQKELKDINDITITPIEMEDWLYLADVFFDNFIFDFMALSRINKNHKQLKEGLQEIVQLQDHLLQEKWGSKLSWG